MIGYNKPLYILPFDHRGSFTKGMFGIEGRELTESEKEKVKGAKMIIYDAFEHALEIGVPKDGAALLVDEEYGLEILHDAVKKGYTTIQTVEKSGQEVFDFQYENFEKHLLDIHPTFAKVLLRYNPEGNKDDNATQRERVKKLADFVHENGMKLLVEPLIPATEEELAKVHNDKSAYDREIRPELMVQIIKEFQDAGAEIDIWKIEGLSERLEYQHVVHQARSGGRDEVGIVILGRGESKEKVVDWIKAGRDVNGVVGFAVGRTIFWQPLIDMRDGKIDESEAKKRIAENYLSFYNLFVNK